MDWFRVDAVSDAPTAVERHDWYGFDWNCIRTRYVNEGEFRTFCIDCRSGVEENVADLTSTCSNDTENEIGRVVVSHCILHCKSNVPVGG